MVSCISRVLQKSSFIFGPGHNWGESQGPFCESLDLLGWPLTCVLSYFIMVSLPIESWSQSRFGTRSNWE